MLQQVQLEQMLAPPALQAKLIMTAMPERLVRTVPLEKSPTTQVVMENAQRARLDILQQLHQRSAGLVVVGLVTTIQIQPQSVCCVKQANSLLQTANFWSACRVHLANMRPLAIPSVPHVLLANRTPIQIQQRRVKIAWLVNFPQLMR
jgi:hypothetical protein